VAAIDSVGEGSDTRARVPALVRTSRVIDTYLDGSLEGILSVVSSKDTETSSRRVAVLALLKRRIKAKAA